MAGKPNLPSSMVMTRIGGRDYPMVSSPKCKTCQSPHRLTIENALLTGRTYKIIARSLEDLDPGPLGHPSSDGIKRHYRDGHLPLPQAVQRRMMERRAEEIGIDINSEVDTIVDKYTVAQMVVHKGFENLQNEKSDPTVAETLAAIKLLHDLEKSSDANVDQEAWVASVQIMMEVAKEVMSDDQWGWFGRKLSQHPVLNAIARKQSAPQEIEGAVE